MKECTGTRARREITVELQYKYGLRKANTGPYLYSTRTLHRLNKQTEVSAQPLIKYGYSGVLCTESTGVSIPVRVPVRTGTVQVRIQVQYTDHIPVLGT